MQSRTAKGEAQQSHRIWVADAFLTGKQTMRELAVEHNISMFTVRDWVRDRRDSFLVDPHLRPADVVTKREVQSNAAITVGLYGAGGNMSDDSVRRATRNLEKSIIALQKKRLMPTFTYRGSIEA